MTKPEKDKRIEELEGRVKKLEEEGKSTVIVLPYVLPVIIKEVPIPQYWPYYPPQITWTSDRNTTCLS